MAEFDDVPNDIYKYQPQDGSYHEAVLKSLFNINNPTDYFIEVSRGNVEGVEVFSKFGRNPDIDTGSGQDVWEHGGEYTGFPDTAETMEIFSSSGNDTDGGTGARTVIISNLLDANYNVMPNITVTLNGTTPVSLGELSYLRCSRMQVATAGETNANVGTLTLRHTSTTTNIFATISPALNQTQIFAFTVPAGKTLYVPNFNVLMSRANGAQGSANVHVKIRAAGSNVWLTVRNTEITQAQSYQYANDIYFIGLEKTDIRAYIDSVSDNNTIVTGEADGLLIDN